jgi:hypothetical protein
MTDDINNNRGKAIEKFRNRAGFQIMFILHSGLEIERALDHLCAAAEDLHVALKDETSENAEQWSVHIVGPDDVIQKSNELDALRSANAVNIEIERERQLHANDPNYPFAIALAKKESKDPSAYYQQSDLHQQVYETLLWRGDIIPTTEAGVALAEQGERERMAKVREIRERPQYSRDGNCACRVCDWCIARSDIKALLQLLHVQEGRV